MEGKRRQRRHPPPVIRSFVPSRLQEDLLARVYERLLSVRAQEEPGLVGAEGREPRALPGKEEQLIATGGRS